MAKRGAEFQITKDGVGQQNPNGENGIGSQRATAAQLAKRKILSGRAARPSTRMAGGHPASPFKTVDPNIANGTASQQTSFQIPPTNANSSSIFSFGSINGTSGPTFPNPFSQPVQPPIPPPAFSALRQAAPVPASSSLFAAQPIPGFTTTFGGQSQATVPPSTRSAPASLGQPPLTSGFIFGQTPSQAASSTFTKPLEQPSLFGAPTPVDPRPETPKTAGPFTLGQHSQVASAHDFVAAKSAPIFEQSQSKPANSAFSTFSSSTPSRNPFANSTPLQGEKSSLFPALPQPSSPEKTSVAAFTFAPSSTPSQSTQAPPAPSFFNRPSGQPASTPFFSQTPTSKAPLFFPAPQSANGSTEAASTSIFGKSTQSQVSTSYFPPAPAAPLFPTTPPAPSRGETSNTFATARSPSDIEMTSPGNKSADTFLGNSSINIPATKEISPRNEIPVTAGQTSDLMPPSRPIGFSDEQFRQYVTAYRLNALDLSLKRFFKDERNVSDPLPFYNAKRKEILSAEGLSKPFTGIKRKNAEAFDVSNKRVHNNNLSTNGAVAYPELSFEPSPIRRKAEGPFANQSTRDEAPDGKRNRDNAVESSIGVTSSSETSKIFASVANGGGRAAIKPAMETTTPDHSPHKPRLQAFIPASTPTPSSKPSSLQSEANGLNANSGAPKMIGPPKFGNIAGTNFMAQFGDAARKTAEKDAAARKAKQKAEEYDSEEDNEEEWEAKYAAEQEAKKSKIEAVSKNGAFTFQATKASQAAAPKATVENNFLRLPGGTGPFGGSLLPAPTTSSESILAGWKPTNSGASSPFSFSNPNSDAEGSKTGDADNEESDESDDDEAEQKQAKDLAHLPTKEPSQAGSGKAAGRSFFDLIEYNADGTPKRDLSPAHEAGEQVQATEAPANPFASVGSLFTSNGKTTSSNGNPFAAAAGTFKFQGSSAASKDESSSMAKSTGKSESTSTPPSQFAFLRDTSSSLGTSIFAKKASAAKDSASKEATTMPAKTTSPGDNTWKPESPIRFIDSTLAPILSFTAPSPTKHSEPKPLGGLFGSANASTTTTVNPFGHLQSATQPIAGTSAGFGFGFGGPTSKAGSLFTTSVPSSTASLTPAMASLTDSRATSPGATTAESEADSAAGADDEPQTQLDLVESRRGEEDEEVLLAVKAKAHEYAAGADVSRKGWMVRGLGQLRVLKHRETKKTRVILRAEPAGKVILNAALMVGMEYERSGGKSVVFGAATGAGTLSRWSVAVATKDRADELASTLQANKAAS